MPATRPRGPRAPENPVRRTAIALALAVATLVVPLGSAPAAAAEPASVAVVVPITTAAPEGGVLEASALEALTAPTGLLARELDAVLATSATIGLDPMIPASIRALGTAAPESAVRWLERLASAPNEVFLLAYADADLSAFARADALDLADPISFTLDPTAFGPAQTPPPSTAPTPTATPTPTSTPDDAPPPLPTTEELLAWTDAIGPIAWPAEGSATAADVAAYAADSYAAVLLSSSNVSETTSSAVDLGGIPGLVADSAASGLLRDAVAALDISGREDAIARLGVSLDGLAAAHPGRSVVLTLDRGATLGFPGLVAAVTALETRVSTRLVGLSEVLATTSGGATVVDDTSGADLAVADELATAVRAEAAFATILTDPTLLTAPRRLELLALLAVREIRQPGWDERADAYLDRSGELLAAVSIVDAGAVLVTSSSSIVPVSVANGLGFPVTVRVTAIPRLPSIRIDSPAEIAVEPGSTATLRLEAQAITNGEVTVDVRLSSPATGGPIGSPEAIDVDLQAQWETIGLIVGAALALVFVGGIARNVIVRRRAARRQDAAADGDPA